MERDRRLSWEGCFNVRDVGGYVAAGGRRTRWGALLRSDLLCRLTTNGRGQLTAAGVATVIDIRSPGELETDPNPFRDNLADGALPRYLHAPVFTEIVAAVSEELIRTGSVGASYCVSLDRFQRGFGRIVAAVAAAPPGAVLLHCAAGKDRTGMAVGLLLDLVGVDRGTIAADYALSQECLWPQWENDPHIRVSYPPPLCPPEAMVEALEHVDRMHDGTAAYLRAAGVSREMQAVLVDRLTEPI